MLMVAARQPYLLRDRDGWYPGLVRGLLPAFRNVLALDEPSARAFRKAGARGAERVGELVSVHVIPRPHGNLDLVLPLGRKDKVKVENT